MTYWEMNALIQRTFLQLLNQYILHEIEVSLGTWKMSEMEDD